MSASFVFRHLRGGLFTLALLAPTAAGAWGPQGHRLVAELAWDQLTPQAQARIEPLLQGEPDPTLPGIANWADQLRGTDPDLGRRSASWHYVNIGGDRCTFDQARDCPKDNCVVDAIAAQAQLLADTSQPLAARTQALKFLVHFIGDVHQPLHAGHAEDKGGNTVQINLNGKGGNLHSLWDSGLLNTTRLDDERFLQRLTAVPLDPVEREMSASLTTRASTWAEQSCAIVVTPGFYPAKPRIDADYVDRWLPVTEQQLRLGGAQLARVLNQLFDAPE